MSCCGSLFVNLGGGGGGSINTGVLQIAGGVALDSTLRFVEDQNGTDSILQLSTDEVGISRTIALSAGATNVRLINETYTINNSGAQTGTATGIFLNATETALNGMAHNLMDLKVGGESRIKVDNAGRVFTGNSIIIQIGSSLSWSDRTVLNSPADGNLRITNSAGNNFGLLQLGGTTNAFPAIKKNASSAAIDFRLADDTGYSNITLGRILAFGSGASTIRWYTNMDFNQFSFGLTWYNSANSAVIEFSQNGDTIQLGSGLFGSVNSTPAASAIIEGRSTTKGFLPPRMTTTNRDNIVSPATGLQLYNTSTNNTDTFDGTNWQSFGKETKITGSLEVNIASGKVINAIEVSSAMGLGFYNAAAIIQPVTGGASATYANVSGTEIKENDTFDGYTIGNVVKALRDLGLLA
jgi:hypothetical protein